MAWPFIPSYSKGRPVAIFVRPEALQASVAERDTLTQVNGKPFTGKAVLGEAMAAARPGDTLQGMVRSPTSDTERAVAIPLAPASHTLNWAVALVIMRERSNTCTTVIQFGLSIFRQASARATSVSANLAIIG